MRDFFRNGPFAASQLMVSFTNDDDFILFHVPEPNKPVPTDEEITDLTIRLHQFITTRVEEQHGESIAALFDTRTSGARTSTTIRRSGSSGRSIGAFARPPRRRTASSSASSPGRAPT